MSKVAQDKLKSDYEAFANTGFTLYPAYNRFPDHEIHSRVARDIAFWSSAHISTRERSTYDQVAVYNVMIKIERMIIKQIKMLFMKKKEDLMEIIQLAKEIYKLEFKEKMNIKTLEYFY